MKFFRRPDHRFGHSRRRSLSGARCLPAAEACGGRDGVDGAGKDLVGSSQEWLFLWSADRELLVNAITNEPANSERRLAIFESGSVPRYFGMPGAEGALAVAIVEMHNRNLHDGQFWQNEAKMINLFNRTDGEVRCGGADLRLSPCLFTWPDIWTVMRSIDVTTPSPPESIAGLRRAMVNLEYRRHGGGMPAMSKGEGSCSS